MQLSSLALLAITLPWWRHNQCESTQGIIQVCCQLLIRLLILVKWTGELNSLFRGDFRLYNFLGPSSRQPVPADRRLIDRAQEGARWNARLLQIDARRALDILSII